MYGFRSLEYISRVIFPLGGWGGEPPRIKNVHCALNNLAVLDRDRYICTICKEREDPHNHLLELRHFQSIYRASFSISIIQG